MQEIFGKKMPIGVVKALQNQEFNSDFEFICAEFTNEKYVIVLHLVLFKKH